MRGRKKNRSLQEEIDIYELVPRVHLEPMRRAESPAHMADTTATQSGIPLQEHFIDMDDALELNKILNQHK